MLSGTLTHSESSLDPSLSRLIMLSSSAVLSYFGLASSMVPSLIVASYFLFFFCFGFSFVAIFFFLLLVFCALGAAVLLATHFLLVPVLSCTCTIRTVFDFLNSSPPLILSPGVCVYLLLNYVPSLKVYWISLRHHLNFIDNI